MKLACCTKKNSHIWKGRRGPHRQQNILVTNGYRSLVRRVICPNRRNVIVQIPKFDAKPNPNSNLTLALTLTLTLCLRSRRFGQMTLRTRELLPSQVTFQRTARNANQAIGATRKIRYVSQLINQGAGIL